MDEKHTDQDAHWKIQICNYTKGDQSGQGSTVFTPKSDHFQL